MDTNSNTLPEKKIINIEILHLDEAGYGPKRTHTRRQWRKECLDNLLAGKKAFEAWQDSWIEIFGSNQNFFVSYAAVVNYDDGSTLNILGQDWDKRSPSTLDFVGHIFTTDLNLRQTVFEKDVFFQNSVFEASVHFSDAIFNGYAYFDGSTFHKTANFNATNFAWFSCFDHVNFCGSTNFCKATNSYLANFRNATFNADAYFQQFSVSERTNFSGAKFLNYVDFSDSTFNESAFFNFGTTFHKLARFNNSTFIKSVNFETSIWKEAVDFSGSSFKENTYFCKANFNGVTNFENTTFEYVGHFEEASFVTHTPAFRGCQIDSTRLEFSDDRYFPKNENSDDAIKNISFLKRLSDEHGQTDQALSFNAMELRAKRLHTDATRTFKIVTWLYEYVSDYGRSYGRPLIWYGGLLVCTFCLAVIHAEFNSPKSCDGKEWWLLSDLYRKETSCSSPAITLENSGALQLSGYRASFEYSMYRAAGILDFSDNGKATDAVARRLFGQSIEPWWMRIWGVIKAILSTALLFLAALGLRNKYRIK
jgi:Pentapeptide repeats (9 copies)